MARTAGVLIHGEEDGPTGHPSGAADVVALDERPHAVAEPQAEAAVAHAVARDDDVARVLRQQPTPASCCEPRSQPQPRGCREQRARRQVLTDERRIGS